ncbi:MAG TPA: pantetheine-phosphate adenylyltransferase [Candidatus Polarisedimenticolaceae bacterium]|nr:pantetheine-phosphate adenylyltransferase [Candidatus Polarisedimenticolaceae bacterium]
MKRTAVYPGTFDPVTNGHLDLVERGSRQFDRLIIAILRHDEKQPVFSLEERMELLREAAASFPNVEVDAFHGLLVDYAQKVGAGTIVRGLRALSDFEYELQMAMMNRRLAPGVETVFLMPSEAYAYLSSRLVREVARLGGDLTGLVPAQVVEALRRRLGPR